MQKNKFSLKVAAAAVAIVFAAAAHAAAATPQAAHAAAATPQAASGTAEEISLINEQIMVLQAKLKRIDLESQIAKKVSETNSAVKGDVRTIEFTPPVIRSIEGFGGKLSAILAYSSGETTVASEGKVLAGGWRVSAIKESSVTLSSAGHKDLVLNFGYAPAQSSAASMPRMPLSGLGQ